MTHKTNKSIYWAIFDGIDKALIKPRTKEPTEVALRCHLAKQTNNFSQKLLNMNLNGTNPLYLSVSITFMEVKKQILKKKHFDDPLILKDDQGHRSPTENEDDE
jgi:hypothetical protein